MKWLLLAVLLCALSARQVVAEKPPITALVFSPDNKVLVATSQLGVQVYSWPKLALQRSLTSSSDNLHCVAFSPDGKLLAAGGGEPSEKGQVEFLAWPTGRIVGSLSSHDDSVRSIGWASSSSFVTASVDRSVGIWSLSDQSSSDLINPLIQQTARLHKHSRSVSAVCLLKDKKTLISAGDDQSIRVWELTSGELRRSLNQHTGPVHAVALRPGGNGLPMIASASNDRTIRFWQPTIGRMVRYVRLKSEPLAISWVDESLIAAACVDGHVRIVNSEDVSLVHDFSAVNGWAYAIAVNAADGSIAVGGSSGQLRRLTLPSNRPR